MLSKNLRKKINRFFLLFIGLMIFLGIVATPVLSLLSVLIGR